MDITQKISVRMVFTIIASVIAANTVMEFGSYSSSDHRHHHHHNQNHLHPNGTT